MHTNLSAWGEIRAQAAGVSGLKGCVVASADSLPPLRAAGGHPGERGDRADIPGARHGPQHRGAAPRGLQRCAAAAWACLGKDEPTADEEWVPGREAGLACGGAGGQPRAEGGARRRLLGEAAPCPRRAAERRCNAPARARRRARRRSRLAGRQLPGVRARRRPLQPQVGRSAAPGRGAQGAALEGCCDGGGTCAPCNPRFCAPCCGCRCICEVLPSTS